METENKKDIIEALLFVWESPLKTEKIASILEITPEEAVSIMEELTAELREANRGIQLFKVSDGYRLGTRPDLAPYIEKLFSRETTGTLTTAAFEALAIVAYKQPVTRLEVDAIRGVNSDSVLESLVRRKLIKVAGRKDTPGKPLLYATTPDFLSYFGLKDLGELPPLKKETN